METKIDITLDHLIASILTPRFRDMKLGKKDSDDERAKEPLLSYIKDGVDEDIPDTPMDDSNTHPADFFGEIVATVDAPILQPVEEYVNYKRLKLSVQDQHMSPLQFWYNDRTTFPKIYKIVRRLLSAPATSSASERCFSTLGLLINDRRSTIESDIVDDLVSVKSNADKVPDLKAFKKK